MITIVDCGSQLTQNIMRRVREKGVDAKIVPFRAPLEDIVNGAEGIIISGGQFSVYDENSPLYDKQVLETGLPVLGICYGQQSIAHLLGGKVSPSPNREFGTTKVRILTESELFTGVPKEITTIMSHGDVVEEMPPGFTALAKSAHHLAAMKNGSIYAVQFHPEADQTEYGRTILANFLDVCNAQRTWDPEKVYDNIVAEMAERLAGRVGVGGISGGVDSTAASVLVSRIASTTYHPIFVNNGLLRLGEADEVLAALERIGIANLHYVDASDRFLSGLTGVLDPDQKRKIIGNEFINVFQEEGSKLKGVSYLVQGTLYPDVVESVPIYGSSSKIKRHHNVGGLPEHMDLEVIEPFRYLFKDEVRKIAERKLGLPHELAWRHPFPGPGLAIRILGEVNEQNLGILREADSIYMDELKSRGLYNKIGQAFAVLLDINTTGVMGDAGTYQKPVVLRAVVTDDFMTSTPYRFAWDALFDITNRIQNEVKGVSKATYDLSGKPPSTIEWE